MTKLALLSSLFGGLLAGCASEQRPAATAEEVRDGEAVPPTPPPSASSAPGDSASVPTAPVGAAASTPAPEAPPVKEALSEAQIAKLSELVNAAEVEQARLAQKKAKAPAVRRFAARMAEHHTAAQRAQAKLLKKLGLAPAESGAAATLRADAEKALATLKAADANGFDDAYLRTQVEAHQKVLEVIDTQALPAATTPEVADALRIGRSLIEQHLKEAQALETP